MRRILVVACLVLAAAGGLGWQSLGSNPGIAHAAPACSKVDLCLSIQSDGNTWWIVIGGQHLQSGTFVNYSYSDLGGGGVGSVLVQGKGGSLSSTIPGGNCPVGSVAASASGTTSKGASVTANANTSPC
jgi:hypothetical protein